VLPDKVLQVLSLLHFLLLLLLFQRKIEHKGELHAQVPKMDGGKKLNFSNRHAF